MLKNKTIFKSIAVALIMVMMVAALSPSVGMVYATNDPQSTQVEYSVGETEWTFSVPAAQTFGTDNLVLTGSAVAISPKNSGDVISLPNGQEISITIDSANNFELHRAINDSKNSVIAYSVYQANESEDVLLKEGNTVLTYTAGKSSNTGVSQELKFVTTEQKIQNATITGEHTDTLTFTVNVSGGTSGGGSESGGSTTTPTISTFTIKGGGEYQFEEGMTFGEWVNSSYNTDGWEINYTNTSTGEIVNNTLRIRLDGNERAQTAIVANRFYPTGPYLTPTGPTFTIDGTSYQFEEGMTWADWVDSEYNNGDYYIDGDEIIYTLHHDVSDFSIDWGKVHFAMSIDSSRTYHIGKGGAIYVELSVAEIGRVYKLSGGDTVFEAELLSDEEIQLFDEAISQFDDIVPDGMFSDSGVFYYKANSTSELVLINVFGTTTFRVFQWVEGEVIELETVATSDTVTIITDVDGPMAIFFTEE